jgi:hypothetical protein
MSKIGPKHVVLWEILELKSSEKPLEKRVACKKVESVT